MTNEEILARLRGILQESFEIDPEGVGMSTRLFEELGLDSIDAVDLAVKIQTLTGKRIAPEVFKSVRTVSDVVTVVQQLLAA
jgi:acyl carrier protein